MIPKKLALGLVPRVDAGFREDHAPQKPRDVTRKRAAGQRRAPSPCVRGAFPSPQWREVEIKIRSRGADAPEVCEQPSKFLPPRNKEGGEAPKGASSSGPRHTEKCCHLPVPGRGGASSGMRSPSGAPPRLLSQRPNASTQPRPRFPRSRGCGRYPHHQSRLSKAPCAPVIMPAGTMPGPPGSGVTSPARRNRSRSAIRCVSRSRPSVSEIRYR